MFRVSMALVAASVIAAPAAAQSMSAETFYQRAQALKKKGPLALFNKKEINALMSEGKAAGMAAGEREKALRAKGKRSYCEPNGKARLSSDDVMGTLGRMGAAERRRIDMTEAMHRAMVARYPCRG